MAVKPTPPVPPVSRRLVPLAEIRPDRVLAAQVSGKGKLITFDSAL